LKEVKSCTPKQKPKDLRKVHKTKGLEGRKRGAKLGTIVGRKE